MSEQIYALLSWNGQAQGSFTATEIKNMWEKEEISGLYQVLTDQGNLSVQEFVSFIDEQNEKERIHQQQLALAQAEAENLKLQQKQMEAEATHRMELERVRVEQEQNEKARVDAQLGGKIYHIYMDGEKKGPFSKQNLQVMYRSGKIDDSTQVWTHDLGEWVELRGFQEIVGGKSRSSSNSFSMGGQNQNSGFRHSNQQAYAAKPIAETPVALIFWGWFLGTIGPFCFSFAMGFFLGLFKAPLALIGVLAIIIYWGCGIAAFVISIILACSPNTAGRVNGIILLVLFVVAVLVLLSIGGSGIYY
jgi:hypothetical protein